MKKWTTYTKFNKINISQTTNDTVDVFRNEILDTRLFISGLISENRTHSFKPERTSKDSVKK